MQLQMYEVVDRCARASDMHEWPGKLIFILATSAAGWSTRWLSERKVVSVDPLYRTNRKGEYVLVEGQTIRVKTLHGTAPFYISPRMEKLALSSDEALAKIDAVLAGGKFAGRRETFEAIRNKIANAEEPVVFG